MLALRSFAARRHSTTTRPLDYLQTWVGGGASNAAASKPDQHGSSSEGNFRTSAGPSVPPGAGVANLPHVSITGNTFLLPTVKLPRSVTPDTLHSALQAAAAASPAARNLLQGRGAGVPLVVDLAEFIPDGSPHFVPVHDSELTDLLVALRRNSLCPVAVTSTRGMMENSIERVAALAGLPNVMGARGGGGVASLEQLFKVVANSNAEGFVQEAQQQRPVEEQQGGEGEREEARVVVKETVKIVEKVVVERVAEGETRVYEGHVRSGQQVSSNENGSLIIIGNVSSGGEVVADGDIHVYGKLRGRALAGLAGAEPAGRIYASSFDPELVCVNGVFTTVEAEGEVGFTRGGSVMAYLGKEDGELQFKSL